MPLSKQIIGGLYIFTLIVMIVSGWTVPQRPVAYDLVLVVLSDVLLIASAPLFWKVDFIFAAVFMCVAFGVVMGIVGRQRFCIYLTEPYVSSRLLLGVIWINKARVYLCQQFC